MYIAPIMAKDNIFRRLRKQAGLSQKEAAHAAGLSESGIQYIERTGGVLYETALTLFKVYGHGVYILPDDIQPIAMLPLTKYRVISCGVSSPVLPAEAKASPDH